MAPFISLVVPLYNEELVIKEMYQRIRIVMEQNQLDHEIIMVNDGSRDRTLNIAQELCRGDSRVKLINFSRNFGHQIAISAGMEKASGQVVVIIDADLQDPPEVIVEMIDKWREGYQVVYGVRKKREGESIFKLLTASVFYRVLRVLTAIEIPVDAGDFRLMDRKVVEQLTQMREKRRFVRGMVSWLGFKQGKVEYIRQKRFRGETKYPFTKMLRFALDGILSFSQIPLRFSTALGFACSLLSFGLIVYGIAAKYFYPETTIRGWTSIFVVCLFLGGVQLISIGILGEYLGRIYDEVKARPLYVVEDEMNFAARQPPDRVLKTLPNHLERPGTSWT